MLRFQCFVQLGRELLTQLRATVEGGGRVLEESDSPPRRRLDAAARHLYLVAATMFGALGIVAFARANQKQRFQEIDVERINIVAANGQPRPVIANAER